MGTRDAAVNKLPCFPEADRARGPAHIHRDLVPPRAHGDVPDRRLHQRLNPVQMRPRLWWERLNGVRIRGGGHPPIKPRVVRRDLLEIGDVAGERGPQLAVDVVPRCGNSPCPRRSRAARCCNADVTQADDSACDVIRRVATVRTWIVVKPCPPAPIPWRPYRHFGPVIPTKWYANQAIPCRGPRS